MEAPVIHIQVAWEPRLLFHHSQSTRRHRRLSLVIRRPHHNTSIKDSPPHPAVVTTRIQRCNSPMTLSLVEAPFLPNSSHSSNPFLQAREDNILMKHEPLVLLSRQQETKLLPLGQVVAVMIGIPTGNNIGLLDDNHIVGSCWLFPPWTHFPANTNWTPFGTVFTAAHLCDYALLLFYFMSGLWAPGTQSAWFLFCILSRS